MNDENKPKERPKRPPQTIPEEPGTHPIPGMRKVIAKRLAGSMQNSPHFYLVAEVDMEPAAAFRKKCEEEGKAKPSFNDMVIKAAALALKDHPHVNAYFKENEVEVLENANVGFAVALEQGLTVPVIRDADQKSLEDISKESKDLAERAREGKLQMTEIQGGGITVSNLGMFEVDLFTAIINPPQSAILAISSIKKVPVVDGDEIRPGMRMKATMSSDHRMIDGVLAAKYMKSFKDYLEEPSNL
ncbi:MAG: 2-oxo acid dehydrogenase subunit E2 [Candidatus Omnitrophica bacterium]|nr:2-oxo acid dehydrogenase subunit E2 [Candidatus Omnitrophota bacterium]